MAKAVVVEERARTRFVVRILGQTDRRVIRANEIGRVSAIVKLQQPDLLLLDLASLDHELILRKLLGDTPEIRSTRIMCVGKGPAPMAGNDVRATTSAINQIRTASAALFFAAAVTWGIIHLLV